jgi:hypothetical protein
MYVVESIGTWVYTKMTEVAPPSQGVFPIPHPLVNEQDVSKTRIAHSRDCLPAKLTLCWSGWSEMGK